MLVFVDGAIYEQQSAGGISRIFNEILPRMCVIDESLQIELLLSGESRQTLPAHPRIHLRTPSHFVRFYRLARRWINAVPGIGGLTGKLTGSALSQSKSIANAGWNRGPRGTIWHSTYYTMPPPRWHGSMVISVVDMIPERFPHLFNTPNDDLLRKTKAHSISTANVVICISETTKKDVQNFLKIDGAKVVVVPLAHSQVFRVLKSTNNLRGYPIGNPFVLYVGSRAHYKDFSTLLRAFGRWARREAVDLIVAGSPCSEVEKQIIIELNLSSQVHFLTDVGDVALCRLYNQAAAFVYPSLYEGFGIPLLEAMVCGCPIVASRIPSTVEVAGNVPVYFEAGAEVQLASALDLALGEGRNSNRVQVGLYLVRRYSWDKTAGKILDIYRTLVN